MKIIENYLPNTVFKNIKEQIEATTFPWYYNDYSTHPNSEPQLVHSFLYKNIPSSYTGILQPILEEIPAQQFLRIKGNLNWQTSKIIETGEHIDSDDSKLKSAIFFITLSPRSMCSDANASPMLSTNAFHLRVGLL